MEDFQDIIMAFVDAEPVDARDLKRALADTEAREYLVDLLALRKLVTDKHEAVVATAPRRRVASPRWLVAAAVVVCVSGLTGYMLGQRTAERNTSALVQTRLPDNGVRRETPSSVFPTPTTVIRLQPGVDWDERRGGS